MAYVGSISMKPEIQRYPTFEDLSENAADFICQLAEESVERRGVFMTALAGGSTPKTLYEYLAQPPYVNRMPWANMHLFWGDERYVPFDHPESNFAMASMSLIQAIPIPAQNIHRVPTELESPEKTAEAYEHILRTLFQSFASFSEEGSFPVFDLILLGMGKDGHTASLFPGSPILDECERWVAATPVSTLKPFVRRITLTLPVINAARNVLLLVVEKEKLPVVQTILEFPEKASDLYPVARVTPRGKFRWFLVEE